MARKQKKEKYIPRKRYEVYCRKCEKKHEYDTVPDRPCPDCDNDLVTITDHKHLRTFFSLKALHDFMNLPNGYPF